MVLKGGQRAAVPRYFTPTDDQAIDVCVFSTSQRHLETEETSVEHSWFKAALALTGKPIPPLRKLRTWT